MIVGYFRRIEGAGTAAPTALLRAERCLRTESDDIGSSHQRSRLLADLAKGDVLVSPSIPHLAASATDLLMVVGRVHRVGATLRLVAEQIDTTIPAARNALVALAEYDRRQLAARRQAGRYEAKLLGVPMGRPRKLDDSMLRTIRQEVAEGRTFAAIARTLGVHPTTVMRLLRRAEAAAQGEP
jgi:DNA invertase Pin-like site-specific DNA recombinase